MMMLLMTMMRMVKTIMVMDDGCGECDDDDAFSRVTGTKNRASEAKPSNWCELDLKHVLALKNKRHNQ